MKSGIYHCGMVRNCGFDIIDITISVKSTLTLIEDKSRFKDGHIKMLFDKGKTATIGKDKPSRHAIIDWGDDSFTIYPFRNGVPFYFVLEEKEL